MLQTKEQSMQNKVPKGHRIQPEDICTDKPLASCVS